ncbi:hypothetical protein [Streptomyces sp. NPDC057257]|uniref:hypothetical protein n=1 Tax=Streptomyces sp. NPDC057257 TaxID=3346071 RepID=UPI00363A5729
MRTIRGTGALLLLAGLLPIAGVVNPRLWDLFTASPRHALALLPDRLGAWQTGMWLLMAGTAVSIAATAALTRLIDTTPARCALALFTTGSALLLVSYSFDLSVSTWAARDAGAHVPGWYWPLNSWSASLFAGSYGLLTSTALLVYGGEVVRTRVLRRWTGWVLVGGGAGLLVQFAAFGSEAPAPQFVALAVVGAVALVRRHEPTAPRPPRTRITTHV